MFLVTVALFLFLLAADGDWKRVPIVRAVTDTVFGPPKVSGDEEAALTIRSKRGDTTKPADLTEEESSEGEDDA